MPKHARDGDASEAAAPPSKKGPALDEPHQGTAPGQGPRRDKDRADEPEPAAAPRVRVSGGSEAGEAPGHDGDQESQARRLYIDWTLEDIDGKTMHVRYCSGAPDSLCQGEPATRCPESRPAPLSRAVPARVRCACMLHALAHADTCFLLVCRATAAVCRGDSRARARPRTRGTRASVSPGHSFHLPVRVLAPRTLLAVVLLTTERDLPLSLSRSLALSLSLCGHSRSLCCSF